MTPCVSSHLVNWSGCCSQPRGQRSSEHIHDRPNSQVGWGPHSDFGFLSAGELDILITLFHIVAQQLFLQRKFALNVCSLLCLPVGFSLTKWIPTYIRSGRNESCRLLLNLFPTYSLRNYNTQPICLAVLAGRSGPCSPPTRWG